LAAAVHDAKLEVLAAVRKHGIKPELSLIANAQTGKH
jgi:hypothetical protein